MQHFHPGFQGLVNVQRTQLSDDPDTAVAQTIQHMAAYASVDARSPAIRQLADQLRGADLNDTRFRCWNWIRARVSFVQDRHLSDPIPDTGDVTEVLVRPVDIIRMPQAQGDCDDFAMLGASLATALGLPAYFITVAADPKAPDQFSHVYLEFAGVAFDASHGPYLGWEVENRFGKRQLWSVANGMPVLRTNRRGLRGIGDCPVGYTDSITGVCSPGGLGTIMAVQAVRRAVRRRGMRGLADVDSDLADVQAQIDADNLAAGQALASQTYDSPVVTPGVIINPVAVASTPISSSPTSSTSFWDNLLGKSVSSTLSILQARLGVPPPGTIIQTAGGTISTVAQIPGAVASGSVLLPGASITLGGLPWYIWAGGLVAVFAIMGGKGKK